jgi:hypothetical protein
MKALHYLRQLQNLQCGREWAVLESYANLTLATEPRSGRKKSKDRVTPALITSRDGINSLEPWIIRKS